MMYNQGMNSSSFKKFLIYSFLPTVFLFPVLFVSAQSGAGGTGNPGGVGGTGNPPQQVNYRIQIPNPLKNNTNDIPALIELIIKDVVVPIGATVVVVMIIYSGFLYVTAQGKPDKIKTAHQAILYAVIGAAVLLGARVLATVIRGTVTQLGG